MKKNTVLAIGLCSILAFSVTACSNAKDTTVAQQKNSGNVVVEDEDKESKEEEEKQEEDKKEDSKENKEVVNGIAFKDEKDSAIFTNKHKEYKFDDKAKEKLKKLDENDLVEYEIKDGKITDVKKIDKAEAVVKYIGLSDSTNGQFESDGVVFSLQIPEDVVDKLEDLQEDQLIKIHIKENKDGGNNILESFEINK